MAKRTLEAVGSQYEGSKRIKRSFSSESRKETLGVSQNGPNREGLEPIKKRADQELKKSSKRKKEKREHEDGVRHVKKGRETVTKNASQQIDKTGDAEEWMISSAKGGALLDLDPLFSSDEQHLILAYDTSIQIYSTSTSLLVRRIQIKKSGNVAGFALATDDTNVLYVSTDLGSLQKWDWTQGTRLGQWQMSFQITSLATAHPGSSRQGQEIVYTIGRMGQYTIDAHVLGISGTEAREKHETILRSIEPLTALRILDHGRTVIATSGSRLIIGDLKSLDTGNNEPLSYVWREITCPEWITSLDVRSRVDSYQEQRSTAIVIKDRSSRPRPSIDVVLGILKGSIYIYRDLLGSLKRKENQKKHPNPADMAMQRLHWHRNGVMSAKWSLDGNYVISGGLETVLVLWQLETGHKQFLPHLSAAIESIVVSPSGSSYAIRLADNSAMILSTTELKPTTSISGIQTRVSRKPLITLPHKTTVDTRYSDPAWLEPIQAVSDPKNPSQLFLAVPSSSSSRLAPTYSSNATYLQTFDSDSGHQISRQALTRTNITNRNAGPEGNTIQEPNVKHFQISYDGQWLATVDEWHPPDIDTETLAPDETVGGLEVCLKFWSWSTDRKTWELVAKIHDPHMNESFDRTAKGRVLCLVSDPCSTCFATIGDDNLVRIWRPKPRRRDGVEVRSQDGQGLKSWSCRHVISLPKTQSLSKDSAHACLAFSQDGSLLAAGSSYTLPTVDLIDVEGAAVCNSQPNAYSGRLLGLAVLDRYLICLGAELNVYDLVNDELHYSVLLTSYGFSALKLGATTHLAINQREKTFAITFPQTSDSKNGMKMTSQIAVFSPDRPLILFSASVPKPIVALVSTADRNSYYIIDAAAEVRQLTSKSHLRIPSPIPSTVGKVSNGLENLFGAPKADDQDLLARLRPQGDGDLKDTEVKTVSTRLIEGDDTPVIWQDDLTKIFDVGPAYALPPIEDLFEQVVALCTSK